MEMVGFVIGLLVGAMLGMFIVCCLVAGNETELQMAQIIETYDNEVNRQYKVIKKAIEYIKNKYDYILKDDTFLDHDERIDRKQILNLLEILKGEDNE